MEITAKEFMANNDVEVTYEPNGMYVIEKDVYRMMEEYHQSKLKNLGGIGHVSNGCFTADQMENAYLDGYNTHELEMNDFKIENYC